MASGTVVLILIFLFVFLGFLLGVYCHICGEANAGGRYFGSNENIASVVYVGGKKGGGGGPTRNKCRCSNKFKGSCKACQGEDFVDDGDDGAHPDFSDFGGDKGFDSGGSPATSPGWGNSDPIRSFLGGNSNNSGGANNDSSAMGGGGDSGGAFMSDA